MAWPNRRGTMFAGPSDRDYPYPHYHGSSPHGKEYLSYDGYERFSHPTGRDMHRRSFDVPSNPYQPPFARAFTRDTDLGAAPSSMGRLGLSIPEGSRSTYGAGWSGGPEGRSECYQAFASLIRDIVALDYAGMMSLDQQLAYGPERGYGHPQRYGLRRY